MPTASSAAVEQLMSDNLDIFACPSCRGDLDRAESSWECCSCGKAYPLENGLSVFHSSSSTHGEFTAEEMAEMYTLAETEGWKGALRAYAGPRRPTVVDLVLSPKRSMVFEPLADLQEPVILDLGCGLGGLSMQLATRASRVFSLDGSKPRVSFLNLARQQEGLENVIPVCHDGILQLPFKNERFDAIVLVGVFEYLPLSVLDRSVQEAHLSCLAELQRILRPGGRLLIASKNRFGWQYLKGGSDHSGIPFGPAMPRAVTNLISLAVRGQPYRIINYSPSGYRRLVEAAGFHEPQLFWTQPGYQFPDFVVPVDEGLQRTLKDLAHDFFPGWKGSAVALMAKLGILQRVLPYVTVVARKAL